MASKCKFKLAFADSWLCPALQSNQLVFTQVTIPTPLSTSASGFPATCGTAGPYRDKPCHLRLTLAYSAVEMVSGRCGNEEVIVDARAQDAWGLGCIIVLVYCAHDLFEIGGRDQPATCNEYQQLHADWVSPQFICASCHATLV